MGGVFLFMTLFERNGAIFNRQYKFYRVTITFWLERERGMWAIILITGIVGFFHSEPIQSYRQYSNHNSLYKFVWAVSCESGLRSSGYSVAPTGHVFFKQVSNDGTVGAVCSD